MPNSARLDDLLPYLMNRLVSQLNQDLGDRLRRGGHSFQDWRILAVLAAHDGITLSQLAEAAVIPQPTVSRLVAGLERKGFLRRRPRARDSRFIEARITARGRAEFEVIRDPATAKVGATKCWLTGRRWIWCSATTRVTPTAAMDSCG